MNLAPFILGLFLLFVNVNLSGCITGPSNDTEVKGEIEADHQTVPERAASGLELGPIENEDLRTVVYQGLGNRLSKTLATGENSEESTEIGDYESFRFTILKLTRGNDDVSGEPTAIPDGMDVEVSGWFKRTVVGDDETKSQCTSFDAHVTLLKKQGEWTFSDEHPVTFGREDPEDCY